MSLNRKAVEIFLCSRGEMNCSKVRVNRVIIRYCTCYSKLIACQFNEE